MRAFDKLIQQGDIMSAYKKNLLAALLCGVACTALAVPKGGDYYKGGSTLNSVEVNGDPYRKTEDKAALSFKGSSFIEVQDIVRPIRSATGNTPINGNAQNADVDGKRNTRYVTLHDVVPAAGHIINPRLGQAWYEKRANGTEVYSLRQTTFLSPEFGGLVVAKVPGLKDGNNVYFGEWAPREALPARNSTDLNMNSRQRSAWYAGDNPITDMPRLVNVKYNVLGVSKHTPGRNDFFTGVLTANYGDGSGKLSGELTRGSERIDFKDTYILSHGKFSNVPSAGPREYDINGRFYGNNAEALAGTVSNRASGDADISFGGHKQ